MVEVRRFENAGEVIEGWAVTALRRDWPGDDDLSVLVQSSLGIPTPGQPMTATLTLLALRADQPPLYVQVQTINVTRDGIVECAWDGMCAIRNAASEEKAARQAALQATADSEQSPEPALAD